MSLSIIIDTNIIIDAIFHNHIHSQRVLNAVLKGEVVLVVSTPIVEEMVYTIIAHAVKAGLTLKQAEKPILKIMKLFSLAKHINPNVSLEVTVHAADNKFYECAYASDVVIIVSKDGHVSSAENVNTSKGRRITTYSPWQFISTFNIKS